MEKRKKGVNSNLSGLVKEGSVEGGTVAKVKSPLLI